MSTQDVDESAFAPEAALTTLLGDHPKVRILVVLLSEGRDINVSEIATQAGMSRSTVYNHIGDLLGLEVIEQTRELGGSPLYQLNRDSDLAQHLGKLEWALLDRFDQESTSDTTRS